MLGQLYTTLAVNGEKLQCQISVWMSENHSICLCSVNRGIDYICKDECCAEITFGRYVKSKSVVLNLGSIEPQGFVESLSGVR